MTTDLDRLVTRKVVCAANRDPETGFLLVGPRHWDNVMRNTYRALTARGHKLTHHAKWEQGFIDQHGEFMDRAEAMAVANEAGQSVDVERGCGGDTSTLYSEGLY